jgi:hypothetical protein
VLQIKYADSSFSLRLEYPANWHIESLTGVKLAIYDSDGTNTLAATSATCYTATTLNGAISAGATTLTLAGTATSPVKGDRLRIAASASGPAETVEVQSYNSTSKVATLLHNLAYDHATATAVYGGFCTYAADFSSATNYPLNTIVQFVWQPQGTDDLEIRQLGQIVSGSVNLSDFEARFRALHPVAYRMAETRLASILDLARERIYYVLRARGLDTERIVDQALLSAVLYDLVWILILEDSGDSGTNEYERALVAYGRDCDVLFAQPIWQDLNEDYTENESTEVQIHSVYTWNRGF